MFKKLCKYVENNEKQSHVSRCKNTLYEKNSKGKDEYLETWPQKLQNKHTGRKKDSIKTKQSFNELQGNKKQPNSHVIKSTQGKGGIEIFLKKYVWKCSKFDENYNKRF